MCYVPSLSPRMDRGGAREENKPMLLAAAMLLLILATLALAGAPVLRHSHRHDAQEPDHHSPGPRVRPGLRGDFAEGTGPRPGTRHLLPAGQAQGRVAGGGLAAPHADGGAAGRLPPQGEARPGAAQPDDQQAGPAGGLPPARHSDPACPARLAHLARPAHHARSGLWPRRPQPRSNRSFWK
jgi:hypothetical protein